MQKTSQGSAAGSTHNSSWARIATLALTRRQTAVPSAMRRILVQNEYNGSTSIAQPQYMYVCMYVYIYIIYIYIYVCMDAWLSPPPDFAISPTAPMKYGPIESQISKTLSGGLLQSTRKSQCLGLWFVARHWGTLSCYQRNAICAES